MDWNKIVEMAQRAVDLYGEADRLVEEVRTAVETSRQARSTSDMEKLNALLAEAQQRRRAASHDLDQALAALEQRK